MGGGTTSSMDEDVASGMGGSVTIGEASSATGDSAAVAFDPVALAASSLDSATSTRDIIA